MITPFFPPQGSPQALQSFRLAKALCESGIEVDVLAAGTGSNMPGNSHLSEQRGRAVDRLTVFSFSTPSWARLLGRFIPQLYRFFQPYDPWLYLPGLRACLKQLLAANSYDAIISIAEPLASHAALASAVPKGAPRRVYWFSDPAPLSQNRDMMKLAWRRQMVERLVTSCLSPGVCVVGVTEEILEPLKALAKPDVAFMVLPHSLDEVDWPWPPNRSVGPSSKQYDLSVLHSGALYWERKPFVLLAGAASYAKECGRMDSIHVRLQGVIAPEIAEELRSTSNDVSISLDGPKDYLLSTQAMREADILCVIDVSLPRNIHLPSKLADYVGACKPILYIGQPDSPTCRAMRDVHPAFVQALDADQVARALKWLENRRWEITADDYQTCYDHFSFRNVYRPLTNWLCRGSPKQETGLGQAA